MVEGLQNRVFLILLIVTYLKPTLIGGLFCFKSVYLHQTLLLCFFI